jgi:ADP-ribosylglycohydrolase
VRVFVMYTVPFKPYTDDTAMMKSVALSLIACKGYNADDMVKRCGAVASLIEMR